MLKTYYYNKLWRKFHFCYNPLTGFFSYSPVFFLYSHPDLGTYVYYIVFSIRPLDRCRFSAAFFLYGIRRKWKLINKQTWDTAIRILTNFSKFLNVIHSYYPEPSVSKILREGRGWIRDCYNWRHVLNCLISHRLIVYTEHAQITECYTIFIKW